METLFLGSGSSTDGDGALLSRLEQNLPIGSDSTRNERTAELLEVLRDVYCALSVGSTGRMHSQRPKLEARLLQMALCTDKDLPPRARVILARILLMLLTVDRNNGSNVSSGGAELDAEGLLFHASLAEPAPNHASSPSHARSAQALLQKMPAMVSHAALQLAGEQHTEVLMAWAAGTNPGPPTQRLQGSYSLLKTYEELAPPTTVPRIVALAALVGMAQREAGEAVTRPHAYRSEVCAFLGKDIPAPASGDTASAEPSDARSQPQSSHLRTWLEAVLAAGATPPTSEAFQEAIALQCMRVVTQLSPVVCGGLGIGLAETPTHGHATSSSSAASSKLWVELEDAMACAMVTEAMRVLLLLCQVGGKIAARAAACVLRLCQQLSSSHGGHPRTAAVFLLVVQFHLDHAAQLLLDPEPALRTLLGVYLVQHFKQGTVSADTFAFLRRNSALLVRRHLNLVPHFFPILLKAVAWDPAEHGGAFLALLPGLVTPSSVLPLFHALADLPALVLALQDDEQKNFQSRAVATHGGGSSIAPGEYGIGPGLNRDEVHQACGMETDPELEAVLALMEGSYMGTLEEASMHGASRMEACRQAEERRAVVGAYTKQLMRDQDDAPLGEALWGHPAVAAALRAAVRANPPSARLQTMYGLAPAALRTFFSVVLRDAPDGLLLGLLPSVLQRVDALFPAPTFLSRARPLCIDFVMAAFKRCPACLDVLKRRIAQIITGDLSSAANLELAVHLCWAVGEYGALGSAAMSFPGSSLPTPTQLDATDPSNSYLAPTEDIDQSLTTHSAHQLFEMLEIVFYERSQESTEGLHDDAGASPMGNSEAHLLCVVLSAMAKLAARRQELAPRARTCMAKVSVHTAIPRSIGERQVHCRARECMKLLQDPHLAGLLLQDCPTNNGQGVEVGEPLDQIWIRCDTN